MFAFLATFVLATVTALQAQTLPAGCDRNVTVASGDTCLSICAQNNVTLSQLETLNPSINSGCTNLYIGEVLCLHVTPPTSGCQQSYTVQSGDTCTAIADKFNISLATLYANNPSINDECTNLYIGQVLCITEGSS